MTINVFTPSSLKARSQLHPLLQKIVDEAIKEFNFSIHDATRGKAAQEDAFKRGASKVHFGNSAHNYVPAIAMDLYPTPYLPDTSKVNVAANLKAHIALAMVILKIAKAHGTPIRWGGGIPDKSFNWDQPHFELNPWRTYAKQSKLFQG